MKHKDDFIMFVSIMTFVCIAIIVMLKANNNENDTNYQSNDNNTSGKDKVISVLLKRGFEDYDDDRKMYYSRRSMLAPNGGACEGAEIVHFGDDEYEVHMICYLNGYLAYERTETYNWKYDTIATTINEYNEYNGNLIRSINASIDRTGKFSCNINNCEDYRSSMLILKGTFLDIINEANVTTYDID